MDPTLGDGELVNIKTDDLHAMDYIGWNRRLLFINSFIVRKMLVAWFFVRELPDIPPFGKVFDEFPPPPPPEIIKFPENAYYAIRAGFDFGVEGARKRSGLGYATFKPAESNTARMIEPLPPIKGQEYLDPPGPYLKMIPQNLSDMFIQSDTRGVPFTFTSACGETGCPFDQSLGEYGGYRVPGFLDGEGDQEIGDVDAQITLILLASDESGAPNPQDRNIFGSAGGYPDGNINIYDAKGIGAILPPACGDENHPRPRADLNGDCKVNMKDLAILADEWTFCTALKCP